MAWISELEESKEEAWEEGWERGQEKGREQAAISMLRDNIPLSKVVLYSSLSESRILELQKELIETGDLNK